METLTEQNGRRKPMREILFRGKRIDTGEWVYGGYVYDYHNNSHLIFVNEFGAINAGFKPKREDFILNYYEVIPETVGQDTGLRDKNGVKIFEGDIHKYYDHHFHVEFGYYTDDDAQIEMYGWYLDSNSFEEQGSLGVDLEKYVNIIGNVHDNPELMKLIENIGRE